MEAIITIIVGLGFAVYFAIAVSIVTEIKKSNK